MRIVDCHIHQTAEVPDVSDVLKTMDECGVDRILVMSKPDRVSIIETRRNLLMTKKLFDAAPDRISGLARFDNPCIPGIGGLAEEALTDMGYVGIKMIPDHWYAYEQRIEPFWEKMNSLSASILFHTGILYANDDSSRFCKPLYLEKLLHYPKIRFAMAHISWPWCEECLAVMGRMQAAAGWGNPTQSFIDITPGTPKHIRKQALANAIDYCGAKKIMFGTDSTVPGRLSNMKAHIERDTALFDELGVSAEDQQRIFAGTAEELFPQP